MVSLAWFHLIKLSSLEFRRKLPLTFPFYFGHRFDIIFLNLYVTLKYERKKPQKIYSYY